MIGIYRESRVPALEGICCFVYLGYSLSVLNCFFFFIVCWLSRGKAKQYRKSRTFWGLQHFHIVPIDSWKWN